MLGEAGAGALGIVVACGVALVVSYGIARVAFGALERARGRTEARAREVDALDALVRERERLSRELHDGTAQLLAYLLVRTETVGQLVAADRRTEALAELEGLRAVADGLYVDVRELIVGLRTPVVEGGLAAALQAYAAEFGERHDIQVAVDVEDTRGASSVVAFHHLFRVAQEALANIRKHSFLSPPAATVGASFQVAASTTWRRTTSSAATSATRGQRRRPACRRSRRSPAIPSLPLDEGAPTRVVSAGAARRLRASALHMRRTEQMTPFSLPRMCGGITAIRCLWRSAQPRLCSARPAPQQRWQTGYGDRRAAHRRFDHSPRQRADRGRAACCSTGHTGAGFPVRTWWRRWVHARLAALFRVRHSDDRQSRAQ